MPSGSWVVAEVVVPVRGPWQQRVKQLHRCPRSCGARGRAMERGGVPVQGGGRQSFPLWAHLPSTLRSRDTQLLLAVSRSPSMLRVTLCDTILFQGVGVGWGVTSHMRVDGTVVLGGPVSTAFITVPGTS